MIFSLKIYGSPPKSDSTRPGHLGSSFSAAASRSLGFRRRKEANLAGSKATRQIWSDLLDHPSSRKENHTFFRTQREPGFYIHTPQDWGGVAPLGNGGFLDQEISQLEVRDRPGVRWESTSRHLPANRLIHT